MNCAHCGESDDLDLDFDPADLEDGMRVDCLACGETSVVWLGELVTQDDYHEYRCDAIAAQRDEERAHGDDREEYSSSGGRWESGYRNGREDFRSDC